MHLIKGSHGGRSWWNGIVDEEKEGFLGSQMNSLPDEEVELTNCQVRGYQVLLLVQLTNVSLGSLLYDHLCIVNRDIEYQ